MPDGQRVVWVTRDSSGSHIRRQRWDGSGVPEEILAPQPKPVTAVVPAPVANRFAIVTTPNNFDISIADGERAADMRRFVGTPVAEGGPRFSPDGKWVAYFSDATGQREVYVAAASGEGTPHQVSIGGGAEPVWARTGSTLYYRGGGKLIAAQLQLAPTFVVTGRTPLFEDHFRASAGFAAYDVAADGKSFIMLGNRAETAQKLVVVNNWAEELKERMTAARR
jgi:hypothetical protein